MRVGLFTETYPPYINGVSTSVAMLKKSLEAEGHEVYVVTCNAALLTTDYDGHILRIPGVPIGIYDYRLTSIYPIQAINIIKNWKLDVIHSHTEFGVGTFARIIAKQFNIPLIHTYHTMYEDYTHYITKGYFDGISKKAVKYFTKFYCDTTAKMLIVPSQKTYDLLRYKYHFRKDIYIIPTGMDISVFDKNKFKKKDILDLKKSLGINKDDFVITFVGRIAKEKNIDFLIKEFKQISDKYSHAKLLIIGTGPDIKDLEKLAKSLKIQDQVIFTGKVLWETIPIYYQLADVFVSASNSETQGLTLTEAMASSVPVVCMKDPSFEDILVDNVNGMFFTDGDEFVHDIKYLIDHPKEKEKMSKEALKTAESMSLTAYAKRVINVYEKAISNKKKGFFSRFKRKTDK